MSPGDFKPAGIVPSPMPAYESPQLQVLGSVRDLTEWCLFGKSLGSPDYFQYIPITNCSS